MKPLSLPIAGLVCGSALIAVLSLGCDRAPTGTREWAVTDHDEPPEAEGAPVARSKGGASRPEGVDLVALAWDRNCATCHGQGGRGDGPQAPMVHAPDLGRAEWQGRVSDQDIAQTIRKGRGKMPAFDLPDKVVTGLVARIRAIRER